MRLSERKSLVCSQNEYSLNEIKSFSSWWCSPKESTACQCRRHKRRGYQPKVGKIPWSRKWQTPVFLPGKSHGLRTLVGYCPWSCKESNVTEHTHTHTHTAAAAAAGCPGLSHIPMAEIELKSDSTQHVCCHFSLTPVLEEPISLELDNVSGRVVPEYGGAR